MYYRVTGKGKTVVLLHGFIEDGRLWDETATLLSKKYKVIVPDLEGFGQSPLQTSDLSMNYYADAVYHLLQTEKVKGCAMLGHSMGGYITLHFAEKYPHLLSGFGLINSHCFADGEQKKVNRKKGNDFISRHGTEPFVKELYNGIFHPSFFSKKVAGGQTGRQFVNKLIKQAEQYSPAALIAANTAMMNRAGKEGVLKNAGVPVLLINGKQDESAPYTSTLQQASYPSISDIHFFDQVKHMSLFEKKRETHQAIEQFLAGL